jgi:Ca-activated chloride channel homolog
MRSCVMALPDFVNRGVRLAVVAAHLAGFGAAALAAQGSVATFTSRIDLVRVSAVVRDRKGRFVQDLSALDFVVQDADRLRTIVGFREEMAAVSVCLLFDVSGSMESAMAEARHAAASLLSLMEPRDNTAVFTFDTRLDGIMPFTEGLKTLPDSMSTMTPFGATSLNDAIAQMAEFVGTRQGRRAVIVFTDGLDNSSHLTPSEVSGIASSLDVPVYVFATVPDIDNPSTPYAAKPDSPLEGPLSELAEWTGGRVFVASTPAARGAAARQIVAELRHQYVLAFESSGPSGWHPLVVRMRNKDLTVRARSGYIAGQSRPNSD